MLRFGLCMVIGSLLALAIVVLPAYSQLTHHTTISNAWSEAYDVVAVGDVAYVITTETGLRIMDISQPENLEEIGYVPVSFNGYCLLHDGDFLYVIGNMIAKYDISDPLQPEIVGEPNLMNPASNPFIYETAVKTGDYIYMVGRCGIYNTIDVLFWPEDQEPSWIGSEVSDVQQIFVEGNHVYGFSAWHDTPPWHYLNVYEITGTHHLEQVAMVPISEQNLSPQDIIVEQGNAYIACDYGFLVYDVSNPGNIQYLGGDTSDEIHIPNDFHMIKDGSTIYMAGGCLATINVSNPSNPVFVDVDTSRIRAPRGFAMSDGYGFSVSHFPGMAAIDFTSPNDIDEVSLYRVSGKTTQASLQDNLLLTNGPMPGSTDNNHLNIFEITDMDEPSLLSSLPACENGADTTYTELWAVAVDDDFAYTTSQNDATIQFSVVDISDPANPEVRGAWISEHELYGSIQIVENVAYVNSYIAGVYALNISDPDNPTLLGNVSCGGYGSADFIVHESYLYLLDGDVLHIVDVTDPSSMIDVAWVLLPDEMMPSAVDIFGDYAYVSSWDHGLFVIDIADPTQPVMEVNHPVMHMSDFHIENGYMYSIDMSNTIQVYTLENPATPELSAEMELDHYSQYVYPSQYQQIDVLGDVIAISNGFYTDLLEYNIVSAPEQDHVDEVPQAFHVSQAYPNPFNSSVHIDYEIFSSNGTVHFRLFDILGREVYTESRMVHAGPHTWHFTASPDELASGIYLLQASFGTQSEVRKMTFMK